MHETKPVESYYRARYYGSVAGRFLSEDPVDFESGTNFYAYSVNDPISWADPTGLKQCKKCGLKKGPEYDVSGTIPQNTTFHWHAVFLNDATHDPACCEVRQLIRWNRPPLPGRSAPHSGFKPPEDQPGHWYEDRVPNGHRYGRRELPYASSSPTNSYHGNEYDGADTPGAPFPIPDFFMQFRLIVVDVCSGNETIYTSRIIKVKF